MQVGFKAGSLKARSQMARANSLQAFTGPYPDEKLKEVLDCLDSALAQGDSERAVDCLQWFTSDFATIAHVSEHWMVLMESPFLGFLASELGGQQSSDLPSDLLLECAVSVVQAASLPKMDIRRRFLGHPMLHSLSTLEALEDDARFLGLRVAIAGVQNPALPEVLSFMSRYSEIGVLEADSVLPTVPAILSCSLAGHNVTEGEHCFPTSTWVLRKFVLWVSREIVPEMSLSEEQFQELSAVTVPAILDLARDWTASAADEVFGPFWPEGFARMVSCGLDTLTCADKCRVIDLIRKLLGRTWTEYPQDILRPVFDHLSEPIMEFGAEDRDDGRHAVLRLIKRFMRLGICVPEDREILDLWLAEVEPKLGDLLAIEIPKELPECPDWGPSDFLLLPEDERQSFIDGCYTACSSSSLFLLDIVHQLEICIKIRRLWSE